MQVHFKLRLLFFNLRFLTKVTFLNFSIRQGDLTNTFKFAMIPIAFIFRLLSNPIHYSITMIFVIFKGTLVIVSIRIDKLTLPAPSIILELPFIVFRIWIVLINLISALSVLHSLMKLTFIDTIVRP